MFFFYVQTNIFNENETQTSKREGKRDMQRLNGTNLEPYKELLELAMHDAMARAIIPISSELKNSVMLRSQPSCPRQLWHADVSYKVYRYRGGYVSLFVPIMKNTTLDIKNGAKYGCKNLVELSIGDYMIFGGRVVHAGSAYSKLHFRLFSFIGVGFPEHSNVQKDFPNATCLTDTDTNSDEYPGGDYSDDGENK